MHSLFSRARTTSQSARTSQAPAASDEFGRVSGSHKADTLPPLPPKEKESKKDKKDKSKRQRTISIPKDNRPSFLRTNSPEPELPTQPLPPLQAGGFLPRYIPSAPTTSEREDPARQPYGYLHTEKDVILSLEDVHRLLTVLGEELTLRGLSTPLLFSTQALDVSAPRVRNLIRAFLGTCSDPVSRSGDARFREEACFAGPHELAMTIRWGLARIVRMVNSTETHGFVDFDLYRGWRNSEESQRFPPDHFVTILHGIPPPARPIFTSLFTLLSRLVAYSTASGLTPSTLAGYFGPLIFGLVPASSATFSNTLTAFHRAAHAAEHLLLAHIRWDDDVQRRKTPGAGGLPSRLKEWIRGYPSMLPRSGEADLERMRRGARTVRVASVRRNVRLYSPDLVQSAATWAGEGDLSGRAEWLRVVPKHSGLQARYTDSYRKRLDIPAVAPDSRGPSSDNGHGGWLSSETSSLTAPTSGTEDAKYSSLTDMRWGEFEALGFGGGESQGKRLEFDLTESARQKTRLEKRTTMTWNDFSNAGFLRDDTPLSDTLQFSTPLQTTIQTWPTTSEDIHRKLKKQQKVLPTFGWETTPVAGQEWVVEEAFLDCWADLIWSSGWSEREERTHRDSNWALIDFKALPSHSSSMNLFAQSSDPRTSNQWFVFEEFVPREYRDQLTNPKKKRNALGFSVKPKPWKPATTLNGKPYTSGMAPHSPGYGTSDFDAMLKDTRGVTRKISAGDDTTDSWHSNPPGMNGVDLTIATPTYAPPIQTQSLTPTPTTPKRPSPSPRGVAGSATKSGGLSSRFRIGSAKRGNVGSEYDPNLDFETRTASEGSDSPDQSHPERSFGLGGLGSPGKKHGRKQSKDDAWVDILVADQGRRMRNQDASFTHGAGIAFPTGSSSTLRRGRASSDPDIQQHQQHRMTYGDDDEDYTMGTAPVPVTPPAEYRSSDEEVMPIPREPSPDPAAQVLVHPGPAEPAIPGRPSQETRYDDEPEDYEPESDFEPTSDDHHTREEDVTTQSFAVSDSGYREDDPTTSSLGQPISPKLMPRRPANGVSSLIDMYAERDAQAQAATIKPSRLPVRTAPKPETMEAEALVAPPVPPALEPGRASPSRYVHGAPLHNVMEEDDDEE